MKVAVAADHAGFKLKEEVKLYLQKKGFEVLDFGSHSDKVVDYPDVVKLAARSVSRGECERGVVVCGAGIGASIVANKIHGIRAVLCLDEFSAEYSRRHNDTNVLALAGRKMSIEEVSRFIDIWFSTPFEGERHKRRIDKISGIEKEECQ